MSQKQRQIEEVARWEYRGRECRVVKHFIGHYCGYVKTKIGNEIENPEPMHEHRLADVHGGITYVPDDEGWIGFDCGHSRDLCLDEDGNPWNNTGFRNMNLRKKGSVKACKEADDVFVWTVDKVKEECEEFLDQILQREVEIETEGKCKVHGNEFVYSDKLERKICPFCMTNG